MVENLSKIKKIHFIGIGGIGMSAVARMFLLNGHKVSGSDSFESKTTKELCDLGAKIKIGHNTKNVPKDCNLVVFSIAVTQDNCELIQAKNLNIKTISYPQSLGLISKDKYTIAISGTHGKTTTTAMIAKVMIDTDLDPTVVVGSFMKNPKDEKSHTNFIGGKSNFFVVEACEYRRSFLNINPKIVVITNIDDDHLDYYKDKKEIEKAFEEFALKIPKDGFLICDLSDQSIRKMAKNALCEVIDYSKIEISGLRLKVAGRHNEQNAKAVLAVSDILNIPRDTALKSLSGYQGTWRRFEYKGMKKNGVLIYDDYGHHPTEIEATLEGARKLFPKNKITVVFQPHLYSRTKLLLPKFSKAFAFADQVILTPIYAAREPFDSTITSEILAEKIMENDTKKLVKSFANFEETLNYLNKNLKKNEIVLTMGAGDVFKIAESFLKL